MVIPLNNSPFTSSGSAGYINVKDTTYGALGDGTTDDTAAITAAIAAAVAAGGGMVYFPAGSYKVTSQIAIGGNDVKLVGHGATITGASDTQYRKFLASGRTGVEFRGLIFDGLYASASTGIGAGAVELVDCTFAKVTNCTFKNNAKQGIYILGNCARFQISENIFTNNFCDIFSDDDTTYQPRYLSIVDNDFYSGISSTGFAAFSGAVKISGIGSANSIACHVIRGNKIRNSGEMGIEIQAYVNDCVVEGNSVAGTKWGISVSGCYRTTVTGNNVKASTYIGIEIASYSFNCSVSNNTVDGRDTSGAVVSSFGIAVLSGSESISVTGGNVSYSSGSEVIFQDSYYCKLTGVNLECRAVGLKLTGTQHTHVSGNMFKASATTPDYFLFFDSASANVYYTTVVDNTFAGNVNNTGVYFYSPSNAVAVVMLRNNRWWGAAGSTFIGWNAEPSRLFLDGTNMGGGGTWASYTTTSFGVQAIYMSANFTTNPHHWGPILMDASGGAKTVTLETAVDKNWREFTIIKSDSSGNSVTVACTGGQTINGASTFVLASQWKHVKVLSDGANWVVTSSN